MDEQIALRPVAEDDLVILEELTGDDPAKTGEFAWFGWLERNRWRRRWGENGLLGDDGGTLMVVRGQKRLGFMNWHRKPSTPAAYHWEIGIALLPEEKAGFTREGLLRGIGWRDGAWRDGIWFSVLRTDPAG